VTALQLGFIETISKADANRSTLEGLKQTLQAGVEAEFTLCTKTSNGEMINQAYLKDQVEVLIEPAKDVTNVIVSEKEDGNLQLKYTPKVPGAYSIKVKICGKKFPTCPFYVQVKERELVVVGDVDLKFFPEDEPEWLDGIAVNSEGRIVVTDNVGHCVYEFDKDDNCLRKRGSEGTKPGEFSMAAGVSYVDDNEILIADQGNHKIQHINIHTGTVVKTFGKHGSGKGEFENPVDVCLNNEGRIVVTECGNHKIQMLSREGETISTFGDSRREKLQGPRSRILYKNMFLVTDGGNDCIKVFDQSETFLYKLGKQGNLDRTI